MSFILFYSNYCKFSKQFIKILQQSGEANFFIQVCVDRDRASGKRPPAVSKYSITHVPAIIVNNNKIVGYPAFEWLQKQIESNQSNVPSMASRSQRPNMNIHQIANEPRRQQPVEGFSNSGLFGGDDAFVDISTTRDDGHIYIAADADDSNIERMKGNFIIPEDNITGGAILTEDQCRQQNTNVSTVGGLPSITVSKDKLKSKQLDNAFNKMMQDRENSIPRPPQRI